MLNDFDEELVGKAYIDPDIVEEIMSRVESQPEDSENQEDDIVWQAQEGSQTFFLSCPAFECLNSGTRGSGKSDSLIMDYLKDVGMGWGASWRGILFRETYKQLDDIVSRCMKWVPRMFPGANFNKNELSWTFKDGEKLLLRYMGNPRDYWNYHGHEYTIKSSTYVLMGDGGYKAANDIDVGDLVQTLQGPKKVTKKLESYKPGVKVSVLDVDSGLVSEQHQGLIHPVLTNDGWQRIGMSCLFQTSEQSPFGESALKEVFQFLSGVHQEILLACDQRSSLQSFRSISVNTSKWCSCLNQIFHQLLDLTSPQLSSAKFLVYDLPENLSAFYSGKFLEIFDEEYVCEHQGVLRLFQYCAFLIDCVLQILLNQVHLLQSILYCSVYSKELSSQSTLLHQVFAQCQNETETNLLKISLFDLLKQDQIALNETSSCVQTLIHKALNSQDHCSRDHGQGGGLLLEVLETDQSFSPLQNDVQQFPLLNCKKGEMNTLSECNRDLETPFSYNNPYTRESFQTKAPLTELSFSVSPIETPFDMVDFEVEDANHYITKLTESKNVDGFHGISNGRWNYHEYIQRIYGKEVFVNNKVFKKDAGQQLHIINQNCWIGWEELSNWHTSECYESMISCCRSSELTEINGMKMPRRIRSTTNPFGVGHGWMKQYFVDKCNELEIVEVGGRTRTWVSGHMLENKVLMESDPEYIKSIAAITDPNKRKAWLEGSWDIVAGGAISDLWSPHRHILKPFPIPPEWKVNRSFDWGSSKPFSVGWWAMSDGSEVEIEPGKIKYFPKGTLIRIDEWYGFDGSRDSGLRMTPTEVAKKIKYKEMHSKILRDLNIRPGPADSSIFNNDPGSINIAKKMLRWRENGQLVKGIKWTRSNRKPGSRIVGLELFRDMLNESLKENPEQACFYVFDVCRDGFLRTVPTLPRSEKDPDDADTDSEDHCLHGKTKVWTDKGFFEIKNLVGTIGRVKTVGGKWTDYYDCRKTRENADVVKVYLDNGQAEVCTPDHKFLVRRDCFVRADKLKGLYINNFEGQRVKCLNVEPIGKADVYCLVADETHCFAIEGGIIVHNCYDEVRYRVLDRLLTTTTTEV